MEGLKLRISLFIGVLMLTGLAFTFIPPIKQPNHTEDWIADQLPNTVGEFRMITLEDGHPKMSYRMPESSYTTLRPWGIVPRIYTNGTERYDVVVIASRNKESFHDPRQCFSAQGWNISDPKFENIPTQTRGELPITLVSMKNDRANTFSLYFYKLPNGFIGSNKEVKIEMLKSKLLSGGYDLEGAFIRVIPMHDNPTVEQLKAFTAKYVDATKITSNGYF